jgi:hypothetical protein
MVEGAVYNPSLIVPTAGESDQFTDIVATPPMDAANWMDWPAWSDAEAGLTAIVALVTGHANGCAEDAGLLWAFNWPPDENTEAVNRRMKKVGFFRIIFKGLTGLTNLLRLDNCIDTLLACCRRDVRASAGIYRWESWDSV